MLVPSEDELRTIDYFGRKEVPFQQIVQFQGL